MKSITVKYKKEETFGIINMGKLAALLFCSLALTTIFSCFILYSPNPLKNFTERDPDQSDHHDQKHNFIKPDQKEKENCDLFKGHWVGEVGGSSGYTSSSCSTIPKSKNCFRNGREDREFLNWRWKPEKCDLPRFNAKSFLKILGGKNLAFIGDSVARNHLDSLLCLLSQEEIPIDAYKDPEDRHRIWYFANHDFTLTILWSKFLVHGYERMINGSSSGIFDLHIDKVDDKWARHLPIIDYAIISNAHWFFRPIYLHKNANLIGCVYCNDPNVTKFDVIEAIGMSFRSAFEYISQCEKCNNNLVTLLRTFSPSHFEDGSWNTGGSCNKTSPYNDRDHVGSYEWELRSTQVKEIERVRRLLLLKGNYNKKQLGKKFGVLDVTRAMLMRADGHPGAYWGNKWMKGYNDCVHWCLPGPIDLWNDFLMAILTDGSDLIL
ncbi:hypothetical protein Dsin_030797 [Dipteronia sinensis]|uniref:Trichome birefringence-like N-terminal domain-containing protein n=1 Tax=Dipteronia sinensis TaxID=43782 RepID=A0AAE0DRF5_9ROSI|nr:hypothetical protein Dsin_030797 [Dipteronia sinensis]